MQTFWLHPRNFGWVTSGQTRSWRRQYITIKPKSWLLSKNTTAMSTTETITTTDLRECESTTNTSAIIILWFRSGIHLCRNVRPHDTNTTKRIIIIMTRVWLPRRFSNFNSSRAFNNNSYESLGSPRETMHHPISERMIPIPERFSPLWLRHVNFLYLYIRCTTLLPPFSYDGFSGKWWSK